MLRLCTKHLQVYLCFHKDMPSATWLFWIHHALECADSLHREHKCNRIMHRVWLVLKFEFVWCHASIIVVLGTSRNSSEVQVWNESCFSASCTQLACVERLFCSLSAFFDSFDRRRWNITTATTNNPHTDAVKTALTAAMQNVEHSGNVLEASEILPEECKVAELLPGSVWGTCGHDQVSLTFLKRCGSIWMTYVWSIKCYEVQIWRQCNYWESVICANLLHTFN